MARRQVYGLNPETGRVEHHYVDLGRMSATVGHSLPVVRTFTPTTGSGGEQRSVPNGGTQVPKLKDAA